MIFWYNCHVKNLLVLVLFVLAAVGCGVSYMLLRMPGHEVTALLVKYLAVQPEDESAAAQPEPPLQSEPKAEVAKPAESEPGAGSAKKAEGGDWTGISAADWYAGPRLSEKDFRGKVAMVYAWSSKEKPSVELLSRIEEIWSSFREKPFVLVGSHRGGRNAKIPKACGQLKLTFPMYEGAAFRREPTVSRYPYIYIVNHHGQIVYRGTSDRSATEALVEALTACLLKQ